MKADDDRQVDDYDGIGGTVKRLVTRARLQRSISNQILIADKMFEFCVEKIKGIIFYS